MTIADIQSDFALLDDWEDRYRYVIELGRALPPLPDAVRTDANKVRGCASQVWLATLAQRRSHDDAGRKRRADRAGSHRHTVRDLRRQDLTDIAALDATAVFERLGLKEHLTPQRSNGFGAMVERIRTDARRLQASGASADGAAAVSR